MSGRLPFAVCTLLLAMATAGHARAQDTGGELGPRRSGADAQVRAREHFQAGIAHFNAGRYREAELDFSRGYELTHKAGFLWNMAESARSAGATARAVELYRRYLREAEPDAPRLEHARQWVQTLEAAERQEPAPSEISPSAAAAGGGDARDPEDDSRFGTQPARDTRDGGGEIYEKWWFWTGAGVLVAAGVATALLVSRDDGATQPQVPNGDLVLRWD